MLIAKKTCKICKVTYVKTEVYFRKNGNSWRSGCKKCINKNIPKKTDKQKKEQKAKSNKSWAKRNRLRINERQVNYRWDNIDKFRKRSRDESLKKRDELCDEYLLRLICRRTGFDKKSITKEVIEQKRIIIKLKRHINYGQSKRS